MFSAINEQFTREKKKRTDDDLIAESVLEVEEVLPGSDEELDDTVDPDSVPEDVYKRLDAELDKIVSDPNYDDDEVEEMIDGDDEISDEEIDAVITEACNCWKDPEGLGHPDRARRQGDMNGQDHQPLFKADGQKSL